MMVRIVDCVKDDKTIIGIYFLELLIPTYKNLRVAYSHPEGEVEKLKLPVLVMVVLVMCVVGIIVTGVAIAPLLNWAGLEAGALIP